MEEENSRSFEAFQEKLNQNSKQSIEGKEENKGEKAERSDEQRRLSRDSNCDFAGGEILKGESKAPESETPAPVKLSGGDYQADFDESSHHLSDVPVEYSLQPLQSAEDLKDQVKAVHKESFTGNTGRSAEVQVQHQIQAPDGPSKLEPLRKSVTKSVSSVEISDLHEQKVQPAENGNNACFTEKVKKNFPDPKHLSIVPMRTPSDGYNWRKYGQKQVKSPEGSRSYYRCTFSDCYAKKIECSDSSNRLVETVYRSQHNHDPPQKVNYSRENKPALPIVPVNGSSDTSHLLSHDNDPLPNSPSKEPLLGLDEIPETKQELSDSDDTAETNVKEQYTDGPECKKRQKKNSTGEVEFTPKPGKKPKFVVHAAGEVGISGDGYRWRKYGQKMVKGNPHPRNYYRCTSAGCPVRKHIETATDNSSAVVITYKGVHDHDTPVPRKRNGPKSGITVATSPVSMTHLQNKTNCLGQTQWSEDKEGKLSGEAMVEGEKASESTKTLLSVGFEIKPC